MAHDEHAFALVQEDRHADLLEDEVFLEVVAGGSQSLSAAGDDDHVGVLNVLLLQKFAHHGANAVIETAEYGGLSDVGLSGRVEVEDLAHGDITRL